VRRQEKLDARTLSLQPGKLNGAFFPEDRKLTLEAHDAGADVTMTIRLVKAYLLRAFGMPLPGKIDSHFSSADTGAKGWELDAGKLLQLLEEATSGIASSEVVDNDKNVDNDENVDNDKNSQSNIDELLNEDEDFLGTSQVMNLSRNSRSNLGERTYLSITWARRPSSWQYS